ncbi:hypothetical protein [Emticicia sp. 17c]|uniref:hypothetical protein n=1 Tax=Emticicia sp. 17c TaxID=3127704 RepID=UPI00301CCC2A
MTNSRIIPILGVILSLSCEKRNEDFAFYTQSPKPFSKHLFKLENKFCFSDLRDSSNVYLKNDTSVFTIWGKEDTVYYKKISLKNTSDKKEIIEASNYEMGNFSFNSNFNYDLILNDRKLDVNIIFPESLKGSYSIILDDKRSALLYKSFQLIDKTKTVNLKEPNYLSFDKSQILISYNDTYILRKITEGDVSLFYDLLKYSMREYFTKNKVERINFFETKTEKFFVEIRNGPNGN